MAFILETGQYFGTSQNGIEDKQIGTEGVIFIQMNQQVHKKYIS